MEKWRLLALEAAHRCREALVQLQEDSYLDDPLLDRVVAMCDEIERYYERWSPTRLHRWLGFVFGVMAARDLMTPCEQAALMRELLVAYPEHADRELEYHQDPRNPFQLDIGGQG